MITPCVNSYDSAILYFMETTLGAFIRDRREALGYTSQAAFARDAGIASAHLNQIESGKIALPNADMRRKIAKALGVDHVSLLVAAGELAKSEIDMPDDPRSAAVKRLSSVIDAYDWSEDGLLAAEQILNTIGRTYAGRPTIPAVGKE